mmetsp:Transcript_1680/g.3914  ORF Transcript_1680/g.3914 Transcript_1680/m.3914 type:complete len:137 (+) Transcript_1680:354-764(+)
MAVTPCSLPFFRRHILLATLTTTATTNPSSTSGASPEGKQQTDVVGDTSDLESDIFDEFDEEWQFYMNLIRDDLQRKTKELSYYIGKSIGPQVFVAMLTVAGFSFHLRFPYHVKLRTRETNLMRKFLSLFAEKYVI